LSLRGEAGLREELPPALGIEAVLRPDAGGALARELFVVARAREIRDVVRRGRLAAVRHPVDELAAIDRERERAPHAHVVERGLARVELVPVDREVIVALEIFLLRAERYVLGRRREFVADVVNLPGFVEVHGR